MEYEKYILDNTIRLETGYRGGGLEVDCSDMFEDGAKVSVYQNYLGGGLLGRINVSMNDIAKKYEETEDMRGLVADMQAYYFDESVRDIVEDDYMNFDDTQEMPASAY